MFEVTSEIKEEARKIINEGTLLPAIIGSAPGFWVASEEDQSVQAFTAIIEKGKVYKIGTFKNK